MGKKRDWDEVGEIVEKIKKLNKTYKEGAKLFGTNVSEIYEYNKREKQIESKDQGNELVTTKADKEKSSLPEEVEQLITDYRKSNPDHGFKRIEQNLKSKHHIVVPRKKIREALKRHNLLDHDSSFDKEAEPKKGTRRFEAGYPCELYQMDITNVYIEGIAVHYLICIIDDYSRFCIAADLRDNQLSETLIECLHNASIVHGKPRKILTDQGRGFYTWSMEQTLFQKYSDDSRIEHIVSNPHSPQTLGKVERFHQTVKKELLHKIRFSGVEDSKRRIHDYIRHYNFDRPHQGIGGARPSDRFYGIIGETSRIETELSGNNIDFSKGYLILKALDYTLSVVSSSSGLQVLLNGKVLKEESTHGIRN